MMSPCERHKKGTRPTNRAKTAFITSLHSLPTIHRNLLPLTETILFLRGKKIYINKNEKKINPLREITPRLTLKSILSVILLSVLIINS